MIYRTLKKFFPFNPIEVDWMYNGVYINRKIHRDELGYWEILSSKPTGRQAPALYENAHTGEIIMIVVDQYEISLCKVTREELEALREQAVLCN